MILKNLNQLGIDIKEKIKNYDNKELELSDLFKKEFSKLLENSKDKVEFQTYTTIITTPKDLKIIFPNQWFYIASFFYDFLNSLWIYKGIANDLNFPQERIKNLRNSTIDEDLKSKLKAKLSNEKDLESYIQFLTNYDWWYGSKTIDRSDFFVSSVLNLANVVNVSHSYLADLADYFSKNESLKNLIYEDLESLLKDKTNNKQYSQLKKTEQKIYYGAPGTGKSYKVDQEIQNLDTKFYERVTFHPEYDHTNFVGGYRPKSEKNEKGEDIITYQFVPQSFTNIYERAWNDTENQYYLVIEEINRGNCAEIFGDIFQLLDRNSNYTVSPSTELKEHLEKTLTNKDGINKGLQLPSNLTIYATMNTSDQSLFPMDSAFKRRWDWEYIPICYDDTPENESFQYIVNLDEYTHFRWIHFIKNVNSIIKTNPNLGMDKCIGNYFIKSDSKKITLEEFVNKAVFYLWNDVFKDEENADSIFEKGTSYEDFFPINSNGKDEILKVLKTINIEPTTI